MTDRINQRTLAYRISGFQPQIVHDSYQRLASLNTFLEQDYLTALSNYKYRGLMLDEPKLMSRSELRSRVSQAGWI